MLEVSNLRKQSIRPKYVQVKIDRTSPLGNPFWMKDESMREEVCDKFEVYARNEIANNKSGKFYAAFKELYINYVNDVDLSLMCWCAPKRCHGHTLIKLCEEFYLIQFGEAKC